MSRGARAWAATLVAVAALAVPALPSPASAAPKPKRQSVRYDLDVLGFNDGEPYRLRGAEAEAVLAEPTAVLFRFQSANWMDKDQKGRFVKASEVTARFPHRAPAELVSVYRVDLDRDRVPEMVLVAEPAQLEDGRRYAVTVLELGEAGYRAVWSSDKLPGERYRVVDVRDLNGDGAPEILVSGEAGRQGAYQFHELIGFAAGGFVSLAVKHNDSIHYVDLDSNGRPEIVVRERVGRRGPAYQWTYIDHLHQWDGAQFSPADRRFPRYHDEQTLPALLGDLIDHYDAKQAILTEKVEAMRRVRAGVLEHVKKPADFERKLVQALSQLQKDQHTAARKKLEELDRLFPYEPQVLLGLAQIHAAADRWEPVLDYAIRALTVDPQLRQAWWWAGVSFVQLAERSSGIASFHNAVRLVGKREEGIAFLRARRGEPGMEGSLQRAIDEALAELEK